MTLQNVSIGMDLWVPLSFLLFIDLNKCAPISNNYFYFMIIFFSALRFLILFCQIVGVRPNFGALT
jgi:hypothetical protein